MSPVTVRPGASGNLSYFWGFSALSQNTFVCCVPACTSPGAVQLIWSLYENYNISFRTGVTFEPGKKLVVLDGDGPEGGA